MADNVATEANDIFKILVASDIHLGYAETDPMRSRDSVNTFEEILQVAQNKQVDFILLGGDLFHENKPPRWIRHECVRLLREYCMSEKPIDFDFVSDASVNFSHSKFPFVNYQDENLNIGIPVFTINGNHDDVTGHNLCELDILHESGVLNYFGKYSSVEEIRISPLMFRKNGTQLALFGLGAVRDERLHRLFLDNKVKFLTLADKEAVEKEWFNLFVLHQNRVRHGQTNYIPEKFLPNFFDLVIWGHEHPSFIDPTMASGNEFFVMQPGSTVATALSEGESGDKHVALLRIKGKDFKSEKFKLKTVRQFYFEQILLSETGIRPNRVDTPAKVEKLCHDKLEELLKKAAREHSGYTRQPKEPLIRLSVELGTEFESFNVARFGHQFVGRVANPKDLIIFHRSRERKERINVDADIIDRITKDKADTTARVEDYVVRYFAEADPKNQIIVLTERGMSEAFKFFVDKDEKETIGEIFKHQVSRCKTRLKKENFENINEHDIVSMLQHIHDLRLQKDKQALAEDQQDIDEALSESSKLTRSNENNDDVLMDQEDEDDDVTRIEDSADEDDSSSAAATPAPSRGRGAKRARVSNGSSSARAPRAIRGSRGRGGGSRKTSSISDYMLR